MAVAQSPSTIQSPFITDRQLQILPPVLPVFVSLTLQIYSSNFSHGRLNQWAHWARAHGPRIFFLFEGPPTGCGEIIF